METRNMTIRASLHKFFNDFFDLRRDMEPAEETVEAIKSGVEFRGANLWILILAIFIASLGLNVNSTAVIIGAMLISPLMGPIIGMGLAVGINDFELMKRSLKSYLVASVISIFTATVYFYCTPLDGAQSELLARTSPTIYDVFIALFGGAAGIVALATRGKGNVLPGVAIATALMPPLCTVGFGLATSHWLYSLGAFYLFFINTVFISVATFLGVRMMKFPKKHFTDSKREKKVRQSLILIVVLTMCPSIWMTYGIVRSTIFTSNAERFIRSELTWPESQVISQKINFKERNIHIVVIGQMLTKEQIARAEDKMRFYNLDNTNLSIIQGSERDAQALRTNGLSLKQAEQQTLLLQEQSTRIQKLERRLQLYTQKEQAGAELLPEMKELYPNTRSIAVSTAVQYADSGRLDTLTQVVAIFEKRPDARMAEQMKRWLATRLKSDNLQLIIP